MCFSVTFDETGTVLMAVVSIAHAVFSYLKRAQAHLRIAPDFLTMGDLFLAVLGQIEMASP